MKHMVIQRDFVVNVAGDEERESKSRRFNLAEGLLSMAFILFVLWELAYPFGVMQKIQGVKEWTTILLVGGSLYIFFISPIRHRDTLASWGLGSPWSLWNEFKNGTTVKKCCLGGIVLFLFLGLNHLFFHNWSEVADFFGFDKIAFLRDANLSFPGRFVVLAFGGVLSAIIITFGIRYDNFIVSFRTAMIVALPLLAVIILAAVAHRGAHAFDGITLYQFAVGAFAYVFWGFVQQLLFSSFFGTRVRKAFAPSRQKENGRPPSERPKVALKFAAVFALFIAPAAFFLLRQTFGADAIPLKVLFGFVGFLAAFGGLYGYYYAKDRKRLLAATLSGSCFGAIHINSWGLVAVTLLLGIFLTYVCMEDRNRNLVALGSIQGLLGSSFSLFFSHGQSGALEVDYGVGPWNVHHPTWAVMIIPTLCIIVYISIVFGYLKKSHEE